MYAFVSVLFVLVAILLIGVILIQQPKTAGGLFSGTGQSLLGTSGKPFWVKFTTVLAAIFMLLCLAMSFAHRQGDNASAVSDFLQKQQQQQQAPPPSSAVPPPAQSGANPSGLSNQMPKAQDLSKPVPASSGAQKK